MLKVKSSNLSSYSRDKHLLPKHILIHLDGEFYCSPSAAKNKSDLLNRSEFMVRKNKV